MPASSRSTAARSSAPRAWPSACRCSTRCCRARRGGSEEGRGAARRMVLVGRPLGMYAPYLLPREGRPRLRAEPLPEAPARRIASSFTVFSGMSHRYAAGHFAEVGLLTGVHPDYIRPSDIRNAISLDQEVASHIGGQTRFASLVLGGGDVAWNRRGVRMPSRAAGHAGLQAAVHPRHARGGSPRDCAASATARASSTTSAARSKSINSRLGDADRQRLDLYLSSVREAEQRLQQDEKWSSTPKPQVDCPPPTNDFGGAAAARTAAGNGTTSSSSRCRPIRPA